MDLILDNRVRIDLKSLPKSVKSALKEGLAHSNPEYFKKRAMGMWVGGTSRTISTYRIEGKGKYFTVPRGALWTVIDLLEEAGIRPAIVDRRHEGPKIDFSFNYDGFCWREYQIEAIQRILENETCMVEGAPASGKTEILLGAIARAGLRTGVIVHDSRLFDQWVDRIEKRLGIPNSKIGKVGGGKFSIGKEITVMMQQTARNNLARLCNEFGFVCLDECHHAPAKTFLEVLDSFTAKYRVGASATIERRDLKHFLAHDLFGDIVFKIKRDDLVRMGYTTDVTLHVVETDFYMDYMNSDALQAQEDLGKIDLAEMTTIEKKRYAKEELGLPDNEYPQYLNAVVKDKARNNLILRYVMNEYRHGRKCAIFTKRRLHCLIWKKALEKMGVEIVILWGGKDKSEKERVLRDLERLKSGEVLIGIGTVLDEGLNMPAVKAGFITYRNAENSGQLEQQAGRLARLFHGEAEASLYYFHDVKIGKFSKDVIALKKRFSRAVIHGRQGRDADRRKKRAIVKSRASNRVEESDSVV